MRRVYLSLGSNIDPEKHLRAALSELQTRFGALMISPIYRCAAVGFAGADFLNLAVALDTELDPHTLNVWLHALEDRHGRQRNVPRFSNRTLDIDIVLYDDLVLQGEGNLDIPRAELKYAFVLKPIADIAPDVRHPLSGKTMRELWSECDAEKRTALTIAELGEDR